MNSPEKITKILPNLPAESGVYLMKDSSGIIIYIGKAASLKKRISSYFQKKDHDPKTRVLMKNISDIEYIVTDSEAEALILESTLIKKHKPKYNIRYKDDKRYPYIAVTLKEEFPRIIYTRKLTENGNRYFGPYTDAKAAKNVISMTNFIFKLKTCTKDLPLKKNERPCLNYQMKRCQGLCIGNISKEEYRAIVNNAVKFLEGNIEPVMENLHAIMNDYSGRKEYEKAAQIRDIIFDIQKTSESQKVYVPIGMDQDYIGASIRGSESLLVLFEFRKGVLLGRKISVYENTEFSEPKDITRSFIMEYYRKTEIPRRIITQGKIDDRKLLEKLLTEKSSKRVTITPATTPEDRGIIKMLLNNIDIIASDRNASRQYQNREKGLAELKKFLMIPGLPEVIECFDISNIHGAHAVASMVCFRNGVPDKNSYRRYKIRGYDTPDDPGMIHEAVGRRIQYLSNENKKLPDLIVVDGGKPQLSRAIEAAQNFNAEIKIISIAKRLEEIYHDIDKEPVKLDANSPALHIIRNIRDEAHRFAITYHRKIRDKDLTGSSLDKIPNIGPKIRKVLLRHFKSIKNIKKAGIDDFTNIPGIGKKSAEAIYNFLHPE